MLKRFICEQSGLESVEYAVIAGMITVALIATLAAVGFWVNTRFENLVTTLTSAAPAP